MTRNLTVYTMKASLGGGGMRSMTVGVNWKLENFKSIKGRILKVTIPVSLPFRGRWHAKRDGRGETGVIIEYLFSIALFVFQFLRRYATLSCKPARKCCWSQSCSAWQLPRNGRLCTFVTIGTFPLFHSCMSNSRYTPSVMLRMTAPQSGAYTRL